MSSLLQRFLTLLEAGHLPPPRTTQPLVLRISYLPFTQLQIFTGARFTALGFSREEESDCDRVCKNNHANPRAQRVG